ncbi:MAG: HypC/HybG/HupF family hydrogenase formation chaperone [Frankia sp.]
MSPADTGLACDGGPGCITCGDVAVPLTVATVEGSDARCRDADGREELVAIDLVGEVRPGDRVLVHAGVALERLSDVGVGTDANPKAGR